MAKKTFKVASAEGEERYGVPVGEELELDLTADQERALLAAGWLESTKKAKKEG